MAKGMRRKGISPVIATVIIVAVAIAIAIAVAFWMTGIVGLFTRFEQIQISSAYVTISGSNFDIHLKVSNTGTAPATIDNIFINGVPTTAVSNITVSPNSTTITLNPGESQEITISIPDGTTVGNAKLTHGVSVEVKVHTASGKEYPKLVVLP